MHESSEPKLLQTSADSAFRKAQVGHSVLGTTLEDDDERLTTFYSVYLRQQTSYKQICAMFKYVGDSGPQNISYIYSQAEKNLIQPEKFSVLSPLIN